jgi:hypothetical protein
LVAQQAKAEGRCTKIFTRKVQIWLEPDRELFRKMWFGDLDIRYMFDEGEVYCLGCQQGHDIVPKRASALFGNESVTDVAYKGIQRGVYDKTSLSQHRV